MKYSRQRSQYSVIGVFSALYFKVFQQNLSTTNAFNLDQSRVLSFDKDLHGKGLVLFELTLNQTTDFWTAPNGKHLQTKKWLPAFSPFPAIFSKGLFFKVVRSFSYHFALYQTAKF